MHLRTWRKYYGFVSSHPRAQSKSMLPWIRLPVTMTAAEECSGFTARTGPADSPAELCSYRTSIGTPCRISMKRARWSARVTSSFLRCSMIMCRTYYRSSFGRASFRSLDTNMWYQTSVRSKPACYLSSPASSGAWMSLQVMVTFIARVRRTCLAFRS